MCSCQSVYSFNRTNFQFEKTVVMSVCVALNKTNFLSESTVVCACQSVCWFKQNNIFKL